MRYSLMATVAMSVLLGACGAATHSNNMAMTVDTASPAAKPLSIVPMGEYRTGLFDEGAAEIPAYDVVGKRIFVVNGGEKAIDILDMSNPDKLAKLGAIKLATWGKAANSVAIHGNIVAVAVENEDKQSPGKALFLNTDGDFIAAVTVGALPDMIKFTPDGKHVLVANEGEPNDAFDNDPEGSVSIIPVSGNLADLSDADVRTVNFGFPNAATLQKDENLGHLKTTTAQGDTDGDGDFDVIYSYGARSFSVLNANGDMVFDSGDKFEQFMAANYGRVFNASNTENYSRDDRSDDKGPEPEGLATGYVNGTPYAFIGLERQGGFMVYDLTNPTNPQFVTYHSDRRFSGNPEADTAGELAPEGMLFVEAKDSPTGNAMLIVSSEVSGSTKVYDLK